MTESTLPPQPTELPLGDPTAAHLRGLDHAMDLAGNGWPVVPYLDRPDGKQLTGWPDAATTDGPTIESWFGPGSPYEDCYVGVVPTKVGKTCIDIDGRSAHGGDEAPDGFETASALGLPITAMVHGVSRSGVGKHLWYDGLAKSKRIFPGIDRKSDRGLIRVVYRLPDVTDVYEAVPKPYMRSNTARDERREYSGTLKAWMEAHAAQTPSRDVRAIVAGLGPTFAGHDKMLSTQVRLVKLAGDGHGGVPEALAELMDAWVAAEHKSSAGARNEWSVALQGAVTQFGGTVREHTESVGAWFRDGKLQPADLADHVKAGLALGQDGRVWKYSHGVFVPDDSEIERRVAQALENDYKIAYVATVRSIVTLTSGLPVLQDIPNSEVINLENGVLHWNSMELEPHSPAQLSTVQLPVTFDDTADCPQFDAWLQKAVPADCQDLAWEIIGYSLMPGNPLQRAILLLGGGGNGKGTFLRVLQSMIGKQNIANVTLRDMAEGKFELADIYGKLANIAGDIDAKYLGDAARFKSLTGGDTIQAQRKYGQPFAFTPWAVPIFSANKIWQSADVTDGYIRRWIILPFPNKLVDSDLGFNEQSLIAEAPGILRKAMTHLGVLMARGGFEPRGAAANALAEFARESDLVRLWLYEDDRVTHDAGNLGFAADRAQISAQYGAWCISNGHSPKSATELYKSLRALNFGEKTSNGVRYFTGISIAPVGIGVAA